MPFKNMQIPKCEGSGEKLSLLRSIAVKWLEEKWPEKIELRFLSKGWQRWDSLMLLMECYLSMPLSHRLLSDAILFVLEFSALLKTSRDQT
ncbi:hypothetical protein CEXT_598851 [Caerostris extrusa]|uniref:Uncharacterized protein n=1 Tax=Caerostris extrusa TaxID=172846 RepID=A0AAV4QZX8_CAEEX|nr:hypothetical protein CEXT_598851 [Caerostris extrusa]